MADKFEFELDLDLPDQIVEDLEDQILREAQARFGSDDRDITGDDIESYRYIFRCEVTMKERR